MKKSELIKHVKGLVGTRTDVDGAYGSQCVDLIMYICQKFFGYRTRGNAIDYTHNTLPSGFRRYRKGETNARAGDILVWKFGSNDIYGHIGFCVSVNGNMLTSVEQNVDGNWNYLEVGGPARYRTRPDTCLAAIIRPPYTDGGWKRNTKGWWWEDESGAYPINSWKKISGIWYYFNSRGYAVTGWNKIKGKWYYFNSDCKMQIGWQKINSKWYYLDSTGAMETGWLKYHDTWYYLDEKNGEMVSDEFRKVKGAWYKFDTSGKMLADTKLTVEPSGAIR